MQNLRVALFFGLMFFTRIASAQNDAVILEYIQTYKEIAIAEMQRTGVPAAIKLAQGIHETSAGTSILVVKSNNHFGIKCKSDWTGKTTKHTDDAPNECFRVYASPLDSYKDHSDFLKKGQRYASLFTLDPTDYQAWAYGLKKAGYATNPKYPQVIIGLIEKYNLQDYTMIALGKPAPQTEILAKEEVKLTTPAVTPVVYQEGKKNTELPNKNVARNMSAFESPASLPTPARSHPYPDGEFKINETRVVWVKEGTAFLTIAEKFNVPLARIFEFNDVKPHEVAAKGQLIYLQRKRRTGNEEQHVVKEGETLYDISQQQALRIESLLEYNHLKPGMRPKPGSILYLRAMAPSQPALVTN